MEKYKYFITICAAMLFSITTSFAQDKQAKMALTFATLNDTINVCKVSVTSDGKPVDGVSVALFVKRLFTPLPIGKALTTDTTGVVSFEVPNDIPSADGNLTFIAKVEDDENYGTFESNGDAKLGTVVASDNSHVDERSIFANRSNAPVYFIAASLIIISLVWGTLLWAVLQVFKIKKLSSKKK